jgi:hypothetical protein
MALSCVSLNNINNFIDENIESDIVKYDLLNEITTTAAAVTLPKYTNNFYAQSAMTRLLPNTANLMQYPTHQHTLQHHHHRQLPTLPPHHFISSDDYLLSKPIFSKNYNNQLSSSYINDDYQCYTQPHSFTPNYTHFTPLHTHHTPHHYASNPCLPSYNSYHNSTSIPPSSHITNYSTFPYRNYNNYSSNHQQMFSSSRPPSISSLNRYTTLSNTNYANSYNNSQPYYRTSSRLDLDNPKGGEIKRQVSFKFDVDQMSFDP